MRRRPSADEISGRDKKGPLMGAPGAAALDVDTLAAGRDRVVDAARAVAMIAVAIGHWLVLDLQPDAAGSMTATDVLAALPVFAWLTWVFQVMPVFFAAGGAVAFPSWRRHHESGGTAGAWIAARLWRLMWPTVWAIGFWIVLTQVGGALGVDGGVLDATRGIALIIWFLAIYVIVTALVPVLAAACDRFGIVFPCGLLVAAMAVDVGASIVGYVSSTTPHWSWVNYLFVWAAMTCLGRWWPPRPRAGDVRLGVILAALALVVLFTVTEVTGWYPVSMVGVAGQARSNSTPPTLALALLGIVQAGVWLALRPTLDRLLADRRFYIPVAVAGSRAMTIYLWHLLAVAVLAVALVLPGVWPATAVGSGPWWLAKAGWVALAAVITVPVVALVGRVERAPDVALTTSTGRAAAATVAASAGWVALAIGGFHPTGPPGHLPWFAIAGLALAAVLLRVPRSP